MTATMSTRPQTTGSAKDMFSCRLCQRSFVDANALRMHCQSSKSHKEKQKKPASSTKCDLCNKTFKDSVALRGHIRDSPKHRVTSPPRRVPHPDDTETPARTPTVAGPPQVFLQPTMGTNYHDLQPSFPFLPTGQVYPGLQQLHFIGDIFGTSNPVHYDATGQVWVERVYGIPNTDTENAPLEWTDMEHEDQGDSDSVSYECVPPEVPEPWSTIPLSERSVLYQSLERHCHSNECLSAEHYWTQRPSATDIDMTRKCNDCGVIKRKISTGAAESICRFHPAKKSFEKGIMRGRGGGASKVARCINCPQVGNKGGCIVLPTHDFASPDAKLREMQQTPTSTSNASARKAVVIDCEMVGVLGANNRETSEIVRLCAVDFLTGEVLIDTYVDPMGRVISWRSKFSGVTAAVMREKTRQGQVIHGWKAARKLLWRFIDGQTVLIGHGLNNDLGVLGVVHTRVVDSAILTRLAVGGDCNRHWALKVLMKQFLGLEIQTGKDGHDCLEDTFAAREVVLWCLRNPAQLEAWAAGEREIMEEKKRKAEEKKNATEERLID
ncbi:ribonuclease H-like domain-containing protein [Aspergillus heterothallicus]